jgi:hypothetical protein
VTVVWIVIAVVAVGLAVWYAFIEDPHRVSRDGRTFDCRIRPIGDDDVPTGRWREARAAFADDGLVVRRRTMGRYIARMRRATARYRVLDRREVDRYVVYLIENPDGVAFQLRIPTRSRIVPNVDALISP